jgi:Ca-activated chloride channel family protein
MLEQTVALPLHVNVVPGDQAAGRIAHPLVVTEMAFLTAQARKRDASRRLSDGDHIGAVAGLSEAGDAIHAAMAVAPPEALPEMKEEAVVIEQLRAEAEYGDRNRTSKRLSSDSSRKSRTRGRRPEST